MGRRPDYNEGLRAEALAAYREHGSYRKAGAVIGRTPKRTRELVRDGMKAEMAAARANQKGTPA